MQRLEVSGAVRPIYGSLDVKRLNKTTVLAEPPMYRSSITGRIKTPSSSPMQRVRGVVPRLTQLS